MPDWFFEDKYYAEGYSAVCGTDEAGRGPLAGPVCAAACVLPRVCEIPGLDDSKKLSEKRREALFPVITGLAESFAVAFASVEEIEELNILNASQLAMRRAVDEVARSSGGRSMIVLVDGNIARGFSQPTETVIGGDSKSFAIAAASVLAKVSRDRLMYEADKLYPEYGFAAHKGYPTKEHRAAILKYGPCPLHRLSFLTKLLRGEGGTR